jgi:hypothetical protein
VSTAVPCMCSQKQHCTRCGCVSGDPVVCVETLCTRTVDSISKSSTPSCAAAAATTVAATLIAAAAAAAVMTL